MSRPRVGSVTYIEKKPGEKQGHYLIRVTCIDGSRVPIPQPPGPKSKQARERMKERALALTQDYAERGIVAAPQRKTKGNIKREEAAKGGESMAPWLDAWAQERLARGYTSTRENLGHYREHIKPALGDAHVKDWTRNDLRALSVALDAKVRAGVIAWKTATNVWGTATKMCDDAAESKLDTIRVRSTNPADGVRGPDRGDAKAKQFLWPSEFARFIACEGEAGVPLAWRRLVAVAVYTYARASELRVLRWEDVDLEHGVLHIHRAFDRETRGEKATKTGQARRLNIEPALLPLLRAMREEAPKATLVLPMLPSERALARALRRWLTRAKVDRAELHDGTVTRKNMTFHDLRSTGLTWLAVRGEDPLKIMQRAGHTDFATTQIYIRTAEAVSEGFGDTFPSLQGLSTDSFRSEFWPKSGKSTELQRGGRDSNGRTPNAETPSKQPIRDAEPVAESSPQASTTQQSPAAAPLTVEELRASLAAAIRDHAWKSVEIVQAQIDALERANVIPIDARSRRTK